jgi:phosphate starvation-inducible membrane PsiE
MQGVLLVAAMYIFGVIGLFGITLLPLRAALLLRRHFFLWFASVSGRWLLVSMFLVSAVLLYFCVEITIDMSRCLLGYHCGPNRASGWLMLSSIGVWYSFFEFLSLLFSLLSRKISGVAT